MSNTPTPPLLHVRDLCVAVGERVLLCGVSLAVHPGERLMLSGPSGVGKTSLLRAIAGLDPVREGSRFWGGRSPAEVGMPAWRRAITYVHQTPPPLPDTAAAWLSQIRSFRAQDGAIADDAVALAQGWGVDPELWERPWSRLSGGERQRLVLAVAVSRRPAVLLLDEPTASLDSDAVARVEATLLQHTAIWVTHDVDQARRVGTREHVLS